jgi:hypothetical protein
MRKTTRFCTVLAGLTLVFAACGEDTTGVNSGDLLEADEAFAVFSELQTAVAAALGGVTAPPAVLPAGIMAVPIPESTGNCPAGGTVTVSGNADDNLDQNGLGTITFTLREEINDCGVVHNAVTFTMNGAPRITIDGEVTIGPEFAISGSYNMGGGFSYTSSDGRSGSCALNVGIDFTNLTVTGTVCGQSVTASG